MKTRKKKIFIICLVLLHMLTIKKLNKFIFYYVRLRRHLLLNLVIYLSNMYRYSFIIFVFIFFNCSDNKNNFLTSKKYVNGIEKKVEILRDNWGINHI